MAKDSTWRQLDEEATRRGLWSRPRAEVRQQLVILYLPFAEVVATIKSRSNLRLDPDDVLQEARLGLVRAVDAYDPDNARGASFTTFAGWRLRGAVVEAERSADWVCHKTRAADKKLRERAEAGDDTVSPVDLLPAMLDTSFRPEADAPDSDPVDDYEGSPIEAACMKLEGILSKADPSIAGRIRDAIEAMHEARELRNAAPHRKVFPENILAARWGTTPVGAATILRSCLLQVRSLAV